MNKKIAKISFGIGVSALLLLVAFVLPINRVAALPEWNATGNWNIEFEYLGGLYTHDMTLSQNGSGALTGSGGYPADTSPHTYEWALTSGSVSGSNISFTANYTAGADALSPLTTLTVVGIIASDGSMSGTWSDNYQGVTRGGDWRTTAGTATALNYAPVLDPISDKTIPEIALYSFTATASDSDGDSLTFSLEGAAPEGASITSAGVFSWAPSEAHGPGDYTVTVKVSDGVLTDSQSFIIHVTEVDDDDEEHGSLPRNKDECKKGGWKDFDGRTFKNQGQCISFVNHAEGSDDEE